MLSLDDLIRLYESDGTDYLVENALLESVPASFYIDFRVQLADQIIKLNIVLPFLILVEIATILSCVSRNLLLSISKTS
ncbi:MAG: hypothetical protein P0116_11555 [Candidatus Nitrosocosmicus sp.]|nr:hypothetical protein [Candidatus Nitrosocosmicus sp.]